MNKAICITIPVELIEIMNKQHIDKSGLITGLLEKHFNKGKIFTEDAFRENLGKSKPGGMFNEGFCKNCGYPHNGDICPDCLVIEQKIAGGR